MTAALRARAKHERQMEALKKAHGKELRLQDKRTRERLRKAENANREAHAKEVQLQGER